MVLTASRAVPCYCSSSVFAGFKVSGNYARNYLPGYSTLFIPELPPGITFPHTLSLSKNFSIHAHAKLGSVVLSTWRRNSTRVILWISSADIRCDATFERGLRTSLARVLDELGGTQVTIWITGYRDVLSSSVFWVCSSNIPSLIDQFCDSLFDLLEA